MATGIFGRKIAVGGEIFLAVTEYNGRVGLAPEFCYDDAEVRNRLFPSGIEYDEEFYDRATMFPSVRFFNPDPDEPKPTFQAGEAWAGTVARFAISDKLTKDKRTMVFVTVGNLQRHTRFELRVERNQAMRRVVSGSVVVSDTVVSELKEREFKFRYHGVIIEFKALATPQGLPVRIAGRAQIKREEQYLADIEALYHKVGSAAQVARGCLKRIPLVSAEEFAKYNAPYYAHSDFLENIKLQENDPAAT